MAPEDHTPARPIRISTEDWTEFERTAGKRNRAHVIVQFIRWYNRRPGARLPKRPERADGD